MTLSTELHRHLDASLRAETLAELILKSSAHPLIRTADDVRKLFWITQPMKSLKEVLDCFVLFQKVLVAADVLERIAYEAVEDVKKEGVTTVEFRYSPSFIGEFSQLHWTTALQALQKGLKRGSEDFGVSARLICIVSRDYGVKMAEKTVEFALENRSAFVAVDLAGNEVDFPNTLFKNPFKKLAKASMPVTIHSGEATGPETVWQAIDELGARRIGHGIHSIEDPTLVSRLVRDGIHLEVCPTSNVITKSVESWEAHPLRKLLDAGIRLSINTDDPGIFGVGLDEETKRVRKYFGVSENELSIIQRYAGEDLFKKSVS